MEFRFSVTFWRLTPHGQLSLQGTFCVWTYVKVLWTFENFLWKSLHHLSKMSIQGTIVSGRWRSELCFWGVKTWLQNFSKIRTFRIFKESSLRSTIMVNQNFWTGISEIKICSWKKIKFLRKFDFFWNITLCLQDLGLFCTTISRDHYCRSSSGYPLTD